MAAFTTRNNATSLLAGSLTTGATTLSVTPGEGAKFPAPTAGDWFPLTLAKANGSLEIVKATARSGDVITVVRAQEGTAAMSFSAGDRVELRVTAAVFTELQTKTAEALTAAGTAQTAANGAQTDANTANTAIANTVVRKDSSTGAATLPSGTTAQRPAGGAGLMRYNSTLAEFERWQGTVFLPFNVMDKALNEAPIVTLASAATVNIGAAAANTISISGTTTITAFDSIASGAVRVLVFQGALTLTHNATSLILPGAANITTAAGDTATLVSLGSGNWRCLGYERASGDSLKPVNTQRLCTAWVNFNGVGTPVIRGSYNVSSVVSNSAGDYSINFTTAMDNANYAVAGQANVNGTSAGWRVFQAIGYSLGSVRVVSGAAAGDSTLMDCIIFGGKN